MTIDLSVFTKHPTSPKWACPWSSGAYTYATDGRMVIRLTRIESAAEKSGTREAAARVNDWLTNSAPLWFNVLPVVAPQDQECPTCKGMKCVKVCPECFGDGTITHSTYHNACKHCKGDGYIPLPPSDAAGIICDECDGHGTVYPDFDGKNWAQYGDAFFSTTLLSRLSILSNVMIGPRGALDFALLKFDEGMGIIMPMVR